MQLFIFSAETDSKPSIRLELCRLIGNPVCQESGSSAQKYCSIPQSNASYSTPPNNCIPPVCSSNQTSSPYCSCSYPFTGSLVFRAPSFSDLENSTNYDQLASSMMKSFQSDQLPVESVALSNPHKDSSSNLVVNLDIFPLEADRFNRTGIYRIGFTLSNQTYKPPAFFGPFFFISEGYTNFAAGRSLLINCKKSNHFENFLTV